MATIRLFKTLAVMFLVQSVIVHCDEEDPDEAEEEKDTEAPATILEEYDENEDGKLSWEEMRPMDMLSEMEPIFRKKDADGDGLLDIEELSVFLAEAEAILESAEL